MNIEIVGSVAPRARLIVYFASNTTAGYLDAIKTASVGAASANISLWPLLGRFHSSVLRHERLSGDNLGQERQ